MSIYVIHNRFGIALKRMTNENCCGILVEVDKLRRTCIGEKIGNSGKKETLEC